MVIHNFSIFRISLFYLRQTYLPKEHKLDMLEEYTFVTSVSRIKKGKETLAEHLKNVDHAKVADLIAEQTELVGGPALYERVDNNLKQGVIELSLLRELCDLYKWRRKFFDENFPVLKGSWFTDSFCRDVITFQITENFNQILNIACSNLRIGKSFPVGLFFTTDGDLRKRESRYRIDNLEVLYHVTDKHFWSFYFLTEKFLPGSYLHFTDVAKILSEHYSKSPGRLEEIAMKKCKSQGTLTKDMTPQVLRNDRLGFLFPDDDIPDNLADDGKELFVMLKHMFEKIRSTEDPCPPPTLG